MNCVTTAAALTLLSGGIGLAATNPIQWSPAPPQWVQGSRFVARDWNLSLEAPGAGWTWSYTPEPVGKKPIRAQSVACVSPDSAIQFVASAFESHHRGLDLEEAKDVARGAAKRYQQEGWTAEVLSTTEDSIPLPASYRYVIEARRPDGIVHVYGYVAAKGRLFLLQHLSSRESEPSEFRRFVETFQFVGQPIPDPVQGLGQVHFAIALMVTLLLGGCGWIANRVAGRVVVNLWYAALALLVAGGIALHVALWSGRPHRGTPFEQGETWGALIGGPLFWPFLFAVWRARAVRRQRAAERVDTSRVDEVFG